MAERTRRYAKRPKAFAAVFLVAAVLSALAVAGLAERAGSTLYSNASGRSR